ncbi:MAG: class I SAM-dependent methyltransferase [Planctomycetes bacterium]|nr:class I SAM-dependent methyltransferase [Planctomycetota bacterium]
MTQDDARAQARALAQAALARGEPVAWFEALYRQAGGDAARIPWADLTPHPALVAWLDRAGDLARARAVVVGCGLGDDAEEVARRGARTTAFDVSPAAVDWCRARFPRSPVDYGTADLLALPPAWRGAFDLVVEVYTLQALPAAIRPQAARGVADLVAPGGRAVVVCRGRDDVGHPEDVSGPPWPLSRRDLAPLLEAGLREVALDDRSDADGGRLFTVEYRRDPPLGP